MAAVVHLSRPRKLPRQVRGSSTAEDRRRFPRARERIPVLLSRTDGSRQFEATVYTADVSLTGAFFATQFYLKPGMELDMEFSMPNEDRAVRTRGVIVREVHLDDRGGTESGFAVRFTEYYDDAKTVLASSFLIAELDDFVTDFLRRSTAGRTSETDRLREILIAWEVGKMELREGELDLLRDRIQVDHEGRIRRRRAAGEGA